MEEVTGMSVDELTSTLIYFNGTGTGARSWYGVDVATGGQK